MENRKDPVLIGVEEQSVRRQVRQNREIDSELDVGGVQFAEYIHQKIKLELSIDHDNEDLNDDVNL